MTFGILFYCMKVRNQLIVLEYPKPIVIRRVMRKDSSLSYSIGLYWKESIDYNETFFMVLLNVYFRIIMALLVYFAIELLY